MYVNDSDEPRGTLAYVDNFPAEAAAELDALRASCMTACTCASGTLSATRCATWFD